MTLRGGAIIIGSLLWDNKERNKWRTNHLNCKDGFRVYLPIRYGKLSTIKRNNTYTMVFSNICYQNRYGLGTGWILPIVANINSFNDLKREAKKMGKAEGFTNSLFSDWGSVSLLINPNKEIDVKIKNEWKKMLSKNTYKNQLIKAHLKSEKSTFNPNGVLTIRWPEEVTPKNKIKKLDFLIVTVTLPTLIKGRYPTASRIAEAMKKAKYYDYFLKNRKHGITTFQDKRIFRMIPKP